MAILLIFMVDEMAKKRSFQVPDGLQFYIKSIYLLVFKIFY